MSKRNENKDIWRIFEETHRFPQRDYDKIMLFQGNGTFGLPATREEDIENRQGPYINGFYETLPFHYPESYYGATKEGQLMVDLPDLTACLIRTNGCLFSLKEGEIKRHRRWLDMKTGILWRKIEWTSPLGDDVEICIQRIIPFSCEALYVSRISIKTKKAAKLSITTPFLLPRNAKESQNNDPRTAKMFEGDLFYFHTQKSSFPFQIKEFSTHNSAITLACGLSLQSPSHEGQGYIADSSLEIEFSLEGAEELIVEHYASYKTSIDHISENLIEVVEDELRKIRKIGTQKLLSQQKKTVADFWKNNAINLKGDDTVARGLYFSLFGLFQSTPSSSHRSISAKGLSSNKYDGHYFWDAEMYALPFHIFTNPKKARNVFSFRYKTLPQAKEHAKYLNFQGALFPWRTINGKESSGYYLASTAQFHINSDIAYAYKLYYEVSGDWDFMVKQAAEVIFEGAQFWASFCVLIPSKGYCIPGVTGPDEYTALVDNNFYTNCMTQNHLAFAHDIACKMREENPDEFKILYEKMQLNEADIDEWLYISKNIYLPFSTHLGIQAQDDSFLEKPVWNFSATHEDQFPLLLHFHPLQIYRHQVLKQPDIILANVLLSDKFPLAVKRRNFRYYDPLTTGDSSLSPFIRSIAAAELGAHDLSWKYFRESACMDIENLNKNTHHGVHMATMGGTWMALVYGLAGMRLYPDVLDFKPQIPKLLKGLSFALQVHGCRFTFSVTEKEILYQLEKGSSLHIRHFGYEKELTPKAPSILFSRFPTLQLVIIELEKVLVDSENLHMKAWQKICRENAIPFSPHFYKGISHYDSYQILETLLAHNQHYLDDVEFRRIIRQKEQIFRFLAEDLESFNIDPNLSLFVKELHKHGIRCALSCENRFLKSLMGKLSLNSLFSAVNNPNEITLKKPDPEIFLSLAENSHISPFCCAVIDASEKGIRAASHAGMFSICMGLSTSQADWSVRNFTQISAEELVRRFSLYREQEKSVPLSIIPLRERSLPRNLSKEDS